MSSGSSQQHSAHPTQDQHVSTTVQRRVNERVSSLDSRSVDERRRIEIQEEDTMSDNVGKVIHEFLSRPNRRRPYNSLFHWTVNDGFTLEYHVVLKIEQDPPSSTR